MIRLCDELTTLCLVYPSRDRSVAAARYPFDALKIRECRAATANGQPAFAWPSELQRARIPGFGLSAAHHSPTEGCIERPWHRCSHDAAGDQRCACGSRRGRLTGCHKVRVVNPIGFIPIAATRAQLRE